MELRFSLFAFLSSLFSLRFSLFAFLSSLFSNERPTWAKTVIIPPRGILAV